MPYIKKEQRKELPDFKGLKIENPGELNYLITLLAKRYLECEGLSYGTINDIVGAMEGAKLEFYRRVAVPYEDKKNEENGDVY